MAHKGTVYEKMAFGGESTQKAIAKELEKAIGAKYVPWHIQLNIVRQLWSSEDVHGTVVGVPKFLLYDLPEKGPGTYTETLIKLWPFLLVTTCTFLIVCSSPVQKRSTRKLCGRVLVQTLALVCENLYYEPVKKREADGTYSSWYDFPEDKGFLDEKQALSFLPRADDVFRDRRGVSDECCKKSCSLGELMSYCYTVK